jgi:hypothetical protein
MIGCGPNEKDDPIETRLRELAVDGRRGICGTTKAPVGGGVEVILQVNQSLRRALVTNSIGGIT